MIFRLTMKKIFFNFLLILVVLPVFSQTPIAVPQSTKDTFEKDIITLDSLILNSKLNDSVSNYYKFVYKAENEYIKQNYKKASEYYEKAFGYLKYPFMRDLSRAIYCEKESRKNIDNLKKYLELYLSKTKKKESTYDYSRNLPLQDSIEIVKLIETIKPVVDSSLVNYLNELFRIDQDVRKGLSWPLSEEEGMLLHITDSTNYSKLLEIVDKYPNLSEEIYGTAWSAFSIILNHCRVIPDVRIYIKLHSMVMNGQIDARNYVNSLEISLFSKKQSFGGAHYGYEYVNWDTNNWDTNTRDKFYIYLKQTSKDEKMINKYRNKLYLEDMKSYHKKRIWAMRTDADKKGQIIYYFTELYGSNEGSYKILSKKTYNDKKVKIYYKNKEDKKRIKKAMKEYNKNRNNNDTDTE